MATLTLVQSTETSTSHAGVASGGTVTLGSNVTIGNWVFVYLINIDGDIGTATLSGLGVPTSGLGSWQSITASGAAYGNQWYYGKSTAGGAKILTVTNSDGSHWIAWVGEVHSSNAVLSVQGFPANGSGTSASIPFGNVPSGSLVMGGMSGPSGSITGNPTGGTPGWTNVSAGDFTNANKDGLSYQVLTAAATSLAATWTIPSHSWDAVGLVITAGMAVVQTAGINGGVTSPQTWTTSNYFLVGDYLIGSFNASVGDTLSTVTGGGTWVKDVAEAASDGDVEIWHAVSVGGTNQVVGTLTGGGSNLLAGGVLAASNIFGLMPGSAQGATGTGTTVTTPTIANVPAGALVVITGDSSAAATTGSPSGFTSLIPGQWVANSIDTCYMITTTAGPVSASWSTTGSGTWVAAIAVYLPLPPGSATDSILVTDTVRVAAQVAHNSDALLLSDSAAGQKHLSGICSDTIVVTSTAGPSAQHPRATDSIVLTSVARTSTQTVHATDSVLVTDAAAAVETPVAITQAAGSPYYTGTTPLSTLGLNWQQVGDAAVICVYLAAGASVPIVTSTNVNNGQPWILEASYNFSNGTTQAWYLGKVTATGSDTLTLTFTGTWNQIFGWELVDGTGLNRWGLVGANYSNNSVSPSTNMPFGSITSGPLGLQAFLGVAEGYPPATGVSTSGFSDGIHSGGIAIWDLALAQNTAYAPVATQQYSNYSYTSGVIISDAIGAQGVAADGIGVSDVAKGIVQLTRTLTDALLIVDTTRTSATKDRSTDSVVVSDLAHAVGNTPHCTDAIVLSAIVRTSVTLSRTIDSILVSDAARAQASLAGKCTDSIVVVDSARLSAAVSKTTSAILVTDTATVHQTVSGLTTDTIVVSAIARPSAQVVHTSDSIVLVATTSVGSHVVGPYTDSILMTDTCRIGAQHPRAIDSILVVDTAAPTSPYTGITLVGYGESNTQSGGSTIGVASGVGITPTGTAPAAGDWVFVFLINIDGDIGDSTLSGLGVPVSGPGSWQLIKASGVNYGNEWWYGQSAGGSNVLTVTMADGSNWFAYVAVVASTTGSVNVTGYIGNSVYSNTPSVALGIVPNGALALVGMTNSAQPITSDPQPGWIDVNAGDFADSTGHSIVTLIPGANGSLTPTWTLANPHAWDAIGIVITVGSLATDTVTITDVATTLGSSLSGRCTDSLVLADTAHVLVQQAHALDAVLVADTAHTGGTRTRAVTDSVLLTDVAHTSAQLASKCVDSLVVTDTAHASGTHTRNVVDNLILADVARATFVGTSTAIDTIVITVAATRTLTVHSIAIDAVLLSDTPRIASGTTRSTDTLLLIDIARTPTTISRAIDTIVVNDIVRKTIQPAHTADSILVIDTAHLSALAVRAVDALLVIDTAGTHVILVAHVVDSLLVSDTVQARLTGHSTSTDTIGVNDTAHALAATQGRTADALVIADVSRANVVLNGHAVDTLLVIDTARVSVQIVHAADTMMLTDSAHAVGILAHGADSLLVIDTARTQVTIGKTVDSILVIDVVRTRVTLGRCTDTLVVADIAVSVGPTTHVGSVIDSILATDVARTNIALVPKVVDAIVISSTVRLSVQLAHATDTIVVADSARVVGSVAKGIDAILVSDTVRKTTQVVHALDALTVTDIVRVALQVSHGVDAIVLTDAVQLRMTFVPHVTDSLALVDMTTFAQSQTVRAVDVLYLFDLARTNTTVRQSTTTSIVLVDYVLVSAPFVYAYDLIRVATFTIAHVTGVASQTVNTILITDTPRLHTQPARVVDNVAVSDRVSVTHHQGVYVTDTLAVTDTARATIALVTYVSDHLTITDTNHTTITFYAHATDSIHIADIARATTVLTASIAGIATMVVYASHADVTVEGAHANVRLEAGTANVSVTGSTSASKVQGAQADITNA